MKKTVTSVVMLILAVLLSLPLIVGCPGEADTRIKVKEVKVGGTVPLSGACAYWGISTMEGWVAGAEDINATGGIRVGDEIYNMKIINYDSKTTTADSRAATTRLIEQDKVKYIFTQAAAAYVGMIELSEPAKVLTIAACWGYIEMESPDYFYSFRAEMSDYEQGFAYMPFMFEYYGRDKLKTACFIGPDDKDGYDCYFSYQRLMNYYRVEDLGVEYFEWELLDMYPLVTRILANKPDFIVTSPTPPGHTALIIKAAREMGFTGPIVSPAASETKTILEACGEFADNVILPVCNEEWPTPYQREMAARFENRFGEFHLLAGNYSWWVYALAQAFEDAGTVEDTTAVANALEKVELYDSFVGHTAWRGIGTYGINRQGVYDCYTTLIEKGVARLADVRFPELPLGY